MSDQATDTPTARGQLGGAVHQNAALSHTGLLERMFSQLFTGLVYAQIWEDPVVDMQALDLGPEDDLVCIGSGGCNMMSYLSADPASITVVDLSPAHVALHRLKLAAAQTLTQKQFYDFFGHADRPSNPDLYWQHIRPALDTQSQRYWETRRGLSRRIDAFAKGFYRFGLLGNFISAAHGLSKLLGVSYKPYLESQTLAQQKVFYDRQIAPLFDSPVVQFLARRRASLFGLGIPPAQFDKLAADGGGDVVPVLRERTRKLMCDFPLSENYFAWAAFNRGYREDGTGPVPPYLEARHFATVSKAAARVSTHNRSLTDLLAGEPAESRSAYVMLDAQDWMSDAQLTALWSQITRTARPGARAIFRTGGTKDILPGRVPDAILGRWRYDAMASAKGIKADRSAIYGGFHVYRLARGASA
ncbi:MAG: DUF3419 family protein [Mangrovicoccus sp.]|nr:DUF3419 family protein [Mangrovicoccus sp.]